MAYRSRPALLSNFFERTIKGWRKRQSLSKSILQISDDCRMPFTSYFYSTTVKTCLCGSVQVTRHFGDTRSFSVDRRKYFSDKIKDDLDVKGWMDEIKLDFENERKSSPSNKTDETSSSDSSSSSSDSDSDTDKEDLPQKTGEGSSQMSRAASTSTVQEIEDFTVDWVKDTEVEPEWKPPVPLQRGKTGVYELEELIKVLKDTKARDICVIRLPEEVKLSNYMVIVSALSTRHMKAIAADVRWIYKQRKDKADPHLKLEGEKSPDWFALDLGNVILHIFLPQTRELYDLESLWTLGPEFDPLSQKQDDDKYVFSADDLPWLTELESITENYKEQRFPGSNKKS